MTELTEQQDTALPMGCTQEQIDALGAEEVEHCCETCKHWLYESSYPAGLGVCRKWLGMLNNVLDHDEERSIPPGWVILCARRAEDGEECRKWEEYR